MVGLSVSASAAAASMGRCAKPSMSTPRKTGRPSVHGLGYDWSRWRDNEP